METSVSPGRHTEPLGSPCCNILMTPSPVAPGNCTTLGSTVDQFANDAALSATKRTLGNRMLGRARRPKTEPVVMLCGENHRAKAGGASNACPLSGVEPRRREDGWIFRAVAPFAIRERVDAKV